MPANTPAVLEFPSFLERLQSLWGYYFGALDRGRAEALSQGDLPWRIIRYERIVDPEFVDHPVANHCYVRPDTFERHMRVLARKYLPVSLDELIARIERNENIADGTVAVTFDGGWQDNFEFAFPVLQRYGIPATIFLPTSFVGTDNIFWYEKVLLGLLFLAEQGERFPEFPLFDEAEKEAFEGLAPEGEINPQSIAFFLNKMRELDIESRTLVFGQIGLAVEHYGEIVSARAVLSWEEIWEMSKWKISFGSMTEAEYPVTDYSEEDLAASLRSSYAHFHEIGLEPTSVFSYPDGVVSNQSRELLHKLGMRYAVSDSSTWRKDDPDSKVAILPRIRMHEAVGFTPALFACRLWRELLSE